MQATSPSNATRLEHVVFWAGAGLLLFLLGLLLVPVLNIGFVADDFYLLVDDLALPLTASHDGMHRPLRNAVFKLLSGNLGVHHVLPYRILVIASFAAALALLFRLAQRLGAGRAGALAGVFFLAFCPRNQEVLFWFAAWQDIVTAVFALLACLAFLNFRDSGRTSSLWLAAIAYAAALGFKETMVVIPALLLLIECYRQRSFSQLKTREFWRAYILFAGILLAYCVYFFMNSGMAALAGRTTQGYYGFQGILRTAIGLVRALLNIALPFALSFTPRGIQPHYPAILLMEALFLALLIWRLRLWRLAALTAGWLVCTMLPTAAFAGYFNADRYLFVSLVGVALFIALLVGEILQTRHARVGGLAVCAAAAIYTFAGLSQLSDFRGFWRGAGDEVTMVVTETVRLCPKLPDSAEVDFVNMTHTLGPVAPVFSSGLPGSLHANGFPPSVRILRDFSQPDSADQRRLVERLEQCPAGAPAGPAARTVLVKAGDGLLKPDTACASPIVDQDRSQRPAAWAFLDSGG